MARFGAIQGAGRATVCIEDEIMRMRRKAYWWFRFVVSGRFLEKFLNLRYDAFVARALDIGPAPSRGSRS
jgi:hypothetical protein